MRKILEINDLKKLAKRRVPKMFFDYADSGAWTESTYRANEEDFKKIKLRQRVLVDMTNRSLESEMIGQKVAMPVALSPTGLAGMQHANGEMLAAQAAEEFGVPFTLSTMSICSIEDVASVTKKPFWFQLYVMKDRDFIADLINRAKAAKCGALVLTLDLQIMGQRHKDLRNNLSAPPKFTLRNLWQMMTCPKWCMDMLQTDKRTLRNIAGHAKNVTDLSSLSLWTASQFDPKLNWNDVDAVGDKIEIHLDGGIRSGQDVLKALALGAKGTFIGRSFLYGLGAMGKPGVTKALEIIRNELDVSMALCGKKKIADLTHDVLYDFRPSKPKR